MNISRHFLWSATALVLAAATVSAASAMTAFARQSRLPARHPTWHRSMLAKAPGAGGVVSQAIADPADVPAGAGGVLSDVRQATVTQDSGKGTTAFSVAFQPANEFHFKLYLDSSETGAANYFVGFDLVPPATQPSA